MMRPLAVLMLLLLLAAPAAAEDCAGRKPPQPDHLVHRALYQAQQKMEAKKDAEAAQVLARFAADHPDREHYQLSFLRGALAFQLGHAKEARTHFAKAVELWPCDSAAWRNLAVADFHLERPAQAAGEMIKAHSLTNPPNDQLLYEAAAMWLSAKEPKKALPLLQRLAQAKKPKADWLKALVQTYLVLGQARQAEPVLRRLLNAHPGDEVLWRLLASVELETEDYAGAAAALEMAYRLKPPEAAGWKRLAELYRAAGAPAQAAILYARSFGPHPDAKDEELLARVWLSAEQPGTALPHAQAAAQAAPTARRLALLGRIHMIARDYPAAAKAYRQAAGLAKGEEAARHHLMAGYADMRLENWKGAQKQLNTARSLAKPKGSTAKAASRALDGVAQQLKAMAAAQQPLGG